MQTEHDVHAACFEFSHQGVSAEAGVAHQHVVFDQQVTQAMPEAQVVAAPFGQGMADPAAGGEAKDPEHFCHREAAAFLLSAGLRPLTLVGGGVRHGEAGAIEHFDAAPTPQPSGGGAPVEVHTQSIENGLQQSAAQGAASLAVSGGAQCRALGVVAPGDEPGADFAHHFLAGHGGVEHLEEEGPK